MDCLQHWASIGSFYREDALIRQSKGSFEVAHWLNNTHLNDIQHNDTKQNNTWYCNTYIRDCVHQTNIFLHFFMFMLIVIILSKNERDCHLRENDWDGTVWNGRELGNN